MTTAAAAIFHEQYGDLTQSEYQQAALRTWNPKAGDEAGDLAYLALGLIGEAGEVAEQIKKHFRHGHVLSREHLGQELGDVLWYVAVLADTLGLNLNEIANDNLAKLRDRYPDGFSEERSRNRLAVISQTLSDL